MTEYAIIVAGGKGLRFGSDLPKQFIMLKNRPVLMHAIKAFNDYNADCKVLVCLPQDHISFWNTLCKEHQFDIAHKLVFGGETRFHSVKNGLDAINESDGLVAIHDGVRPLIRPTLISTLFQEAEKYNAAVPCITLADSIRKIERNHSIAVDRSLYRAIQTPQCFNLRLLKQAYQKPYSNLFTDDASVFEMLGHNIHLVEGDKRNIKITTVEDLKIAETFIL